MSCVKRQLVADFLASFLVFIEHPLSHPRSDKLALLHKGEEGLQNTRFHWLTPTVIVFVLFCYKQLAPCIYTVKAAKPQTRVEVEIKM